MAKFPSGPTTTSEIILIGEKSPLSCTDVLHFDGFIRYCTFDMLSSVGIEEIMMIINHVTEGTIGDQNVIRFVIRFGYTYLGKVGNVANFVSVHSGVPSQ